MIKLSGASEFQWKITEQVYTLEKPLDGKTLYAKMYSTNWANGTDTSIPLNTPGLDSINKVFKYWGLIKRSNADIRQIPYSVPAPYAQYSIQMYVNTAANEIYLGTGAHSEYNNQPLEVYIIYKKD